jgi:hypothetical protein
VAKVYYFRRGGKSVGKSKKSAFFIGEVGGHRLRQNIVLEELRTSKNPLFS